MSHRGVKVSFSVLFLGSTAEYGAIMDRIVVRRGAAFRTQMDAPCRC